jgi:hypothetical protein
MTDFLKYDMTDVWASSGDKIAPDSAKIAAGWGVEVVPRQWWNWFENRQDNNIAYLMQKGIPEWDQFTEYQINKSFVQRNGIVYKATATSINSDPVALTSWVRAFPDYTVSLNALGALTPAADRAPYFNGTSTAALMTVTSFARTLLDDTTNTNARTTLGAQASHVNLTALSGPAAVTNTIPYWNSTTTMLTTSLTAFGRSLIDDADNTAARTTLSVYSIAEVDAAITASAGTKQPLDATLTALAGTTTANNTLSYWTGVDTTTTTPFTAFARTILDDADALAVRTTLDTINATNLTTGTVALARLPTNLTGINAATATALQTARTIQGVSFNGTANITLSVVDKDSATGSALIPSGTTAQRSSNGAGKFRFNTDIGRAEINNGSTWGSLGGATGGGNDAAFYLNDQTINNSYTISAGQNAMTAGPITVANGATVTISDGSVWTVV